MTASPLPARMSSFTFKLFECRTLRSQRLAAMLAQAHRPAWGSVCAIGQLSLRDRDMKDQSTSSCQWVCPSTGADASRSLRSCEPGMRYPAQSRARMMYLELGSGTQRGSTGAAKKSENCAGGGQVSAAKGSVVVKPELSAVSRKTHGE